MALYKRVLLKLSGEALKGNSDGAFDQNVIQELCKYLKKLTSKGVEVGIVVGGGNIFRGRTAKQLKLERVSADYAGMTATIINALMIENALNVNKIKAKAFSMLPIKKVIDKYSKSKANKLLKDGYIVIFAGGTGKPYFSTDTASALKAKDIKADIILAGKNGVEGVYDDDPTVNKKAKMFKELSYEQFIKLNLQAFDIEGIKVCKNNNIIIRIFNMNKLENIVKVIDDNKLGTIIK